MLISLRPLNTLESTKSDVSAPCDSAADNNKQELKAKMYAVIFKYSKSVHNVYCHK